MELLLCACHFLCYQSQAISCAGFFFGGGIGGLKSFYTLLSHIAVGSTATR